MCVCYILLDFFLSVCRMYGINSNKNARVLWLMYCASDIALVMSWHCAQCVQYVSLFDVWTNLINTEKLYTRHLR